MALRGDPNRRTSAANDTRLGTERKSGALRTKRVLLGIGLAAGLGGALGFLTQPDLAPSQQKMSAPKRSAETMIVVAEAPPATAEPQAPAALPADELGPDLWLPPPPPPLPPLPSRQAAVARPAAPPAALPATISVPPPAVRNTRLPATTVARPSIQPSFNCRYARTEAERMICSDRELAAADRRLNAAYEQAIAAGVPRRSLRSEQDDWLVAREHAARDPAELESFYLSRIEELEEIAEFERRQ